MTAWSTSALSQEAILASGLPVAGLMETISLAGGGVDEFAVDECLGAKLEFGRRGFDGFGFEFKAHNCPLSMGVKIRDFCSVKNGRNRAVLSIAFAGQDGVGTAKRIADDHVLPTDEVRGGIEALGHGVS